jgi:predicted PurR-regulated permease PerM
LEKQRWRNRLFSGEWGCKTRLAAKHGTGFSSWQKGIATVAAGILALLLLVWVIYVRQSLFMVLTPFLISLALAYLLAPVVQYMERRKISRSIAIIVIYLVFAIVVFVFCVRVMPLFLDDLQEMVLQLPDYAERLQEILTHMQEDYRRFNLPDYVRELIDNNIDGAGELLTAQLERTYNFLINLFGRVLLLLLVPILTFYFLRDEAFLKEKLLALFPQRSRRRLISLAEDIDSAMGAFIRGALLVSLAVGLMTYIGLLILGINFPLVLALIVGITNLIPYIGPILGAVPALLVAILEQPLLALKVLILIVVVQQVESQLITPYVIGRSVRLHPLAIILALLLAGKLFGIVGLILAIPTVIILRILIHHLLLFLRQSQE